MEDKDLLLAELVKTKRVLPAAEPVAAINVKSKRKTWTKLQPERKKSAPNYIISFSLGHAVIPDVRLGVSL